MHLQKESQDVTLRGSVAAMTSVFTMAPGWVLTPAIPKTHSAPHPPQRTCS